MISGVVQFVWALAVFAVFATLAGQGLTVLPAAGVLYVLGSGLVAGALALLVEWLADA